MNKDRLRISQVQSLLPGIAVSILLAGCSSTGQVSVLAQPEQLSAVEETPVYPEVRSTIEATYPHEAILRQIEGWVQVMYTITEDGTTTNAIVVDHEPSNTYIFHDACLNAVATARFDPQPAPVHEAQFVCRFQLEDEDDDCNKIPQRVVDLKNAGEYEAALIEVDKILECYDSIPMIVTHAAERGWIYLEMEDFNSAIESFNNALRPRPPMPFTYLGRALAHEGAGNPELAEADYLATYEVGMAIDPERFLRTLDNDYAYARDRVLQNR